MRATTLSLALLLTVAFLGSHAAAHEECSGTIVDVGGVVYIVLEDDHGPQVYFESNGEPGVQCRGHENPDMQLY